MSFAWIFADSWSFASNFKGDRPSFARSLLCPSTSWATIGSTLSVAVAGAEVFAGGSCAWRSGEAAMAAAVQNIPKIDREKRSFDRLGLILGLSVRAGRISSEQHEQARRWSCPGRSGTTGRTDDRQA